MTTFKLNVQEIKNRIQNGGAITKREFDRLMVKGWKEQKKGYCAGRFSDLNGNMCAIGVVANQLGMEGYNFASTALHRVDSSENLWDRIADESNSAGNKTLAIKLVKSVEWPEGK